MSNFSIKLALNQGWEAFKRDYKFVLLVWVLFLVVAFVMDLLEKNVSGMALVLVGILNFIAQISLIILLTKVSLNVFDNKPVVWPELVGTIKKVWLPMVLGSLAYGLIVSVGMILLIVPGIVWALTYQFYSYRIVDTGVGAKEALMYSKQLSVGSRWNLVGFGAAVFLLNIFGLLALGIGLLVTMPVSMLAMVSVYKQLEANVGKTPAVTV